MTLSERDMSATSWSATWKSSKHCEGHSMAVHTRSKLIDFLTSQDNLPSVLEILRYHDEIHGLVLTRFWTRLQEQLARKARGVMPDGMALHWVPDWREDPTGRWVGINLYLCGCQDQAQALTYRIEHDLGNSAYSLNLGLNWTDEVRPRSSVLSVPEVQRVAEQQGELGFEVPTPPTWWHGKKLLETYAGLNEFLSEYVEQEVPLVRKISEAFWRHVKDTSALVLRANRAIAPRPR